LYNGKKYTGPSEIILECPVHKLPVFVKAGAIIPMQSSKSNTAEISDTLILHIYAGHTFSTFTFYEDDGETFAYEQGNFAERLIENKTGSITLNKQEGNYISPVRKLKVIFHGFENLPPQIKVNDQSHDVHGDINRFFNALEKFDPINDPEPAPEENVYSLEVPYSSEQIILNW